MAKQHCKAGYRRIPLTELSKKGKLGQNYILCRISADITDIRTNVIGGV